MARILVLGAYGAVGSFVARDLERAGHEVIGLGRDRDAARRVLPGLDWIIRDFKALTRRDDWMPLIEGVDFVVNCVGAVQSNLRDRLEITHLSAIGALVLACEKADVGLVQISAVGAHHSAPLEFLRTKAEGDALIRESRARWWIFRPGFVLARQSFGNNSLIRVLASVPLVVPIICPNAMVQTVSVRDIARAIRRVVDGETPPGTELDLVERDPQRMEDVILATRRWLGFARPLRVLHLPDWVVRVVSHGTDVFGYLGWRSPVRTSAVQLIENDVRGDPWETRHALGRDALSLNETHDANPALAEDRLFVRMQLLGPFLTFVLSFHWNILGIIALTHLEIGRDYVTDNGHGQFLANVVVGFLAAATLGLGLALMVRAWASRTLWLMILVTIFYLVGASLLAPNLWSDPNGPLLKAIPMIFLMLTTRLVLDTR